MSSRSPLYQQFCSQPSLLHNSHFFYDVPQPSLHQFLPIIPPICPVTPRWWCCSPWRLVWLCGSPRQRAPPGSSLRSRAPAPWGIYCTSLFYLSLCYEVAWFPSNLVNCQGFPSILLCSWKCFSFNTLFVDDMGWSKEQWYPAIILL